MKSQIKVIIFELLAFCISLDLGLTAEDYVYIHITYMSGCVYIYVYICIYICFKLRQLLAKYPLYS